MQFKKVCVAGTFDHIHAGHERLLCKAFEIGTHILIGLTSDVFVATYKKIQVRPAVVRKQDLMDWLKVHGYNGRYDLVLIDDPYEPALSDTTLEALVVSEDSKKRAEELNCKREKKGLHLLTIIIVPLQIAQDEKPISSTRIREGEIDTKGNLVLPQSLRDQLTKPMGSLLQTKADVASSFFTYSDAIIILVGDATTKTALDAGVKPSLIIIDNKVEQKVFTGLSSYRTTYLTDTHHIHSGPAFISVAAVDAIDAWSHQAKSHKAVVLEIDGEEDLLTLSVIEKAPMGSIVYYGQPHEGMVEVIVTAEKKKDVIALLLQFSVQ